MIRELGDVELFELCETAPKVQCSQCLLHLGIKELCTALADNAWFTANPEENLTKGATHAARHGKTEVQREYDMAWNAWKRCCKKVDSQGEHLQVFTIDFSEIQFIVNHNSQSDGQSQKDKEWDALAKEDHKYKLTPEERRRYKGQWYLTHNKAGKKWAYEASTWLQSRCHDEKSLTPWIRRTKLKSPSIQVNKDEYNKDKKFSPKITCPALELTNIHNWNICLHLQVPRGGTHPDGVESELTFFLLESLFVSVGFVYSYCNRRGV